MENRTNDAIEKTVCIFRSTVNRACVRQFFYNDVLEILFLLLDLNRYLNPVSYEKNCHYYFIYHNIGHKSLFSG